MTKIERGEATGRDEEQSAGDQREFSHLLILVGDAILRTTQTQAMKYRDILKMIHKDGWRLVSQEGSHRQFKHPVKPGRVTIAGHPSKEAAPDTLKSILKQAGLKQ